MELDRELSSDPGQIPCGGDHPWHPATWPARFRQDQPVTASRDADSKRFSERTWDCRQSFLKPVAVIFEDWTYEQSLVE